jgi:hypothetical protein
MTKTKSTLCTPVWRYPGSHTKVGSMWCNNCRDDGDSDCSFVPSKLGVRHLPNITTTVAGDVRYGRVTAQAKSTAPSEIRRTSHQASKPAIKLPSTANAGLPGWLEEFQGRVESIALGDFLSFESSLRDPNRSSLSLEAARINIRSMMSREQGSLEILSQTIQERQQTLSHLDERFTHEIQRLRAEEGGGGPSLHEEDEVMG